MNSTETWNEDRSALYPQHANRFFSRRAGAVAGSISLQNLLQFCLFEAAFYVAYQYGMEFSHAFASPFWFPDSVLLCALLVARPRRWWIFVLAPLPIRLLVAVPAGVPLWFLVATFAIDSAKAVATAAVLRRLLKDKVRIQTVREFALFCLFAVVLVPAVAAFAGAAVRHALGSDYGSAWQQWFTGNAMTHLVVTPALLYWVLAAPWKLRAPNTKPYIEGGLLAVGLVLAGYVAFEGSNAIGFADPRFYAPVPFLFWAAIRFGMLGASGAVSVIAIMAVHAALNGRGPFAGQSPADTAAALQQFLLLRAAPLYLVAILIEQRKSDEQSMRESEERFRNLADTAPVLVWMADVDGRRDFFNRGWLHFTGRTLAQEVGSGWTESIHPDDVQHCLETCESSFDQRRPFELECRLRRHDDTYRWISYQGVPRHAAGGRFVGYVGSAVDITEHKRAEEANRKLAHVQRLATMGEFTAMIAHEVNQPLGAILSNAEAAEMLLETDDPPLDEIREILAAIRKNNLRADESIRRIRGLLRKREMQVAKFDFNDMVSDTLRLVAGDALRRRVQIGSNLSPDLPLAFGDRVHVQHVLLNLVVNGMDAMNATPESQRRLIIETASADNGILEAAVTDCGSGIAPDRMPRVFESFFTSKEEGMGLGLSIARSIVEAHRGRIWAENNAGGGATFRFSLPAANRAGAQESV